MKLLLSEVYLHVLTPVEVFDLMARGCRMGNDNGKPHSVIQTKASYIYISILVKEWK